MRVSAALCMLSPATFLTQSSYVYEMLILLRYLRDIENNAGYCVFVLAGLSMQLDY
jgi:hypothetical protein